MPAFKHHLMLAKHKRHESKHALAVCKIVVRCALENGLCNTLKVPHKAGLLI